MLRVNNAVRDMLWLDRAINCNSWLVINSLLAKYPPWELK